MQITEVAEQVYLVPIPIPIPLKTVNCYALRGPDGWTLVDAGFHDPGAEAAWREAMQRLGIRRGDVEQLLITHYHPDHYGGAGWLQQETGAPVVRMPEQDAAILDRIWNPSQGEGAVLAAFFRRHGMPADVAEAIIQHHITHQGLVEPRAAITHPIAEGEEVRMGGRRFQSIWTPGHTDGLMVYLDPDDGLCLVNDMLLVKITPNVPLWPWGSPNPLGAFLDSLEQLTRIPARLGLPGHRALIADVPGRAREIIEHHGERLQKVLALCQVAGDRGITGWELSRGIFGDQPTIHNTRFAMAEALAHAEYLALREQLHRLEDDGTIRYRHP